jgi:3-oxoacyl-[acyl-carrier protein] reductase
MLKQAIIPLAGLGTRLLPLSSVTPKELLPINGKVNLEHVMDECIEAGIKEIISKHGNIYGLVTCAASSPAVGPSDDLQLTEWNKVIQTDLTGTFITCQIVGKNMIKSKIGRIINISSFHSIATYPERVAYASAKNGVIGLTKSLGKELAKTEIRVNCVTPAVVNTSILDEFTEEHINYMIEKIPIGRTGEVEEVAKMVSWLSSEECSFSTGAVFDISGGRATY